VGCFLCKFSVLGWVTLSPLGTSATVGPIVPGPDDVDDDDDCGAVGRMLGKGDESTQRTCDPSTTLSTNPARPDPDSNPGPAVAV
jgi:hypothetical protein